MVHRDDPLPMPGKATGASTAPTGAAPTSAAPTAYAQTDRLCRDFGLQIIVAHHDSSEAQGSTGSRADAGGSSEGVSHQSSPRSFALAADHHESSIRLTPFFNTLNHLEHYVAGNLVDILHQYFFGNGESDEQESDYASNASLAR